MKDCCTHLSQDALFDALELELPTLEPKSACVIHMLYVHCNHSRIQFEAIQKLCCTSCQCKTVDVKRHEPFCMYLTHHELESVIVLVITIITIINIIIIVIIIIISIIIIIVIVIIAILNP